MGHLGLFSALQLFFVPRDMSDSDLAAWTVVAAEPTEKALPLRRE